jgi:hypothetical protein
MKNAITLNLTLDVAKAVADALASAVGDNLVDYDDLDHVESVRDRLAEEIHTSERMAAPHNVTLRIGPAASAIEYRAVFEREGGVTIQRDGHDIGKAEWNSIELCLCSLEAQRPIPPAVIAALNSTIRVSVVERLAAE